MRIMDGYLPILLRGCSLLLAACCPPLPLAAPRLRLSIMTLCRACCVLAACGVARVRQTKARQDKRCVRVV